MFNRIINIISQALAFSKNEARGTFLLVVLVFIAISSSGFVIRFISQDQVISMDSLALREWVQEVENSYSERKPTSKPVYIETTVDPISEKSTSLKSVSEKKAEDKAEIKPVLVMDLNQANADELREIRGVGKTLSERIIKYRDLLGGYASTAQLNEVYGLDEEVIRRIESRFSIQSGIRALAINSDSVKVLARHPYISYDLAWIILNYRQQNGDISGYEDLRKIRALNDSLLLKIRPYIK